MASAMQSKYDDLNERTKQFAVSVFLFAKRLEPLPVIRWLAKQLVDSSTSVAANQRAARRARSDKELAAKLSIIVEEADESAFWCELLQELELPPSLMPELKKLTNEGQQLVAIFARGRATVRERLRRAKKEKARGRQTDASA
jgi:four helix bundle protein